MKDKRGVAQIFMIIGLLAGILTIMSAFSLLPEVASIGGLGDADYIQAPYYANIKCDFAVGGSKTIQWAGRTGEWISDKLPENTQSWDINLQDSSFLNNYQAYVCPQRSKESNCIEYKTTGSSGRQFTASSDNHILVEGTNGIGLKSKDMVFDFSLEYKAFNLVRDDIFRGGVQQLSDGLGCEIPIYDIAWQNRIKFWENRNMPNPARSLQPSETFNYISGSVTRLAEGNVQDGGYCIYSNGQAKIYEVERMEADKTYYVVNTNSVQGTAQCCDGSNLPDKKCQDGRWIETLEAECSIFDACEGTEWRADVSSLKQAVRYDCVSGQCVKKTKDVECTISTDCSTNEICSTNTFTCIPACVGCDGGDERLPTTQSECVEKGWDWIPATTKTTGIFGVGVTEEVEAHCQKPSSAWITWLILIGIFGLIIFLFRGQIMAGVKLISKRLGI